MKFLISLFIISNFQVAAAIETFNIKVDSNQCAEISWDVKRIGDLEGVVLERGFKDQFVPIKQFSKDEIKAPQALEFRDCELKKLQKASYRFKMLGKKTQSYSQAVELSTISTVAVEKNVKAYAEPFKVSDVLNLHIEINDLIPNKVSILTLSGKVLLTFPLTGARTRELFKAKMQVGHLTNATYEFQVLLGEEVLAKGVFDKI